MDKTKLKRMKDHLSKEFPGCPISISEGDNFTASLCVQCKDGNRIFLIQRKDLDDCPLDAIEKLLEQQMIVKRLKASPWKRISLKYGSTKEEDI
ncbi:MAG: hypothetical protein ACLQVJ_26455 [Syntrophobacteraceae bacterium]